MRMQSVAMRVAALAFLATAGIGVWADYDRPAGVGRFVLLCTGVVLMHGIEWLGRRRAITALGWIGLGCVLAAGLLGAHVLGPNGDEQGVVAGALVILIPIGVGGVAWRWPKRLGLLVASGSASGLLILLLLTGERTALLALAGGIAAGLAVWPRRKLGPRRGKLTLGLSLLALLLIVVIVASVLVMQRFLPEPVINATDFYESLRSRWLVWQDTLVLIGDSPFTGNGLAAFPMVYATYLVMSHVPVHAHAHHLFLQIAVEQGVPGLVAFGMLVSVSGGSLMRDRAASGAAQRLQATAVTALAAMLLHGLLDSELYASGLAPVAFMPMGFALAACHLDQGQVVEHVLSPAWQRPVSVVAGVFTLTSLVIMGWGLAGTKLQAGWYANLGAVAQTRAEIAVYKWPEWPVQDEVRRSGTAPLGQAVNYYEMALALDPNHATAHRRLGQIDLSLGKYIEACGHLERAFERDPGNPVTRALLGEAYAVTGDVEQAAAFWASLGRGLDRVELRYWWYGYIGAEQEAAWVSEALILADDRKATISK